MEILSVPDLKSYEQMPDALLSSVKDALYQRHEAGDIDDATWWKHRSVITKTQIIRHTETEIKHLQSKLEKYRKSLAFEFEGEAPNDKR